jgi:predicted DCC family thiol-disulfide oxidoreductase YuxK
MRSPAAHVTTPMPPRPTDSPRPRAPSWTGGQYSLARALLGAVVAAWFATIALGAWRMPPVEMLARTGSAGGAGAATGIALTGLFAALLFAAGAGDRASSVTVIVAGGLLAATGHASTGAGGLAVAGVLLAHLATPPAPYGSWAARGRTDPAVPWSPGRGWRHAVWFALALAQVVAAAQAFAAGQALDRARAFAGPGAAGATAGFDKFAAAALAAGLVAGAIVPRWRMAVFAAAAVVEAGRCLAAIAGVGALGALDPRATGVAVEAGAFLGALLFAFDPAWIRGERDARGSVLFYDGGCGLCHGAVRFVVAEDPEGATFRFASLQSGLLGERLPEAQRRDLPDSLVVLAADGRVRTRSAAVRFILRALGGYWTIIGRLGILVPARAADALYDFVARRRRRWFAAPVTACPVISPALRQRFLDTANGKDR